MEPQGPTGLIRLLATVSTLRRSLANAAGITYEGTRDVYAALGYKVALAPEDYKARYERNEVAARIVDVFPEETWRNGAELIEDEDLDVTTDFEKAWEELALRLWPWVAFKKADQLAQMARYGVVLIGVPGDLESPIKKLKPQDVLFLAPYGEADAKIQDSDLDLSTNSPRFGMPNYYRMSRVGGNQERKVHWSRILHIADGTLDDRLYGTPRLRRVWNRIDDLEKVAGGGSEAFWLRAHQGYVATVDPSIQMDQPKIDDLKTQVEEFANGMRRTIGQQGVDFKALGSDTADFSKNVESLLTLISAGTGIPKRILQGSERGELASTQDAKAWDDRIADRRTQYAEPNVVRPFIDRLIEFGALPEPAQYRVSWPVIKNYTEDQKLTMATKAASLNKQMGTLVILPDEIRGRYLDLEALAEVDIPEYLDPQIQMEKEEAAAEEAAKAKAEADKAKAEAQPGNPLKAPKVALRSSDEQRLEDHILQALKAAQDHIDYPALRSAIAAQDGREVERLVSLALAKIDQALEPGLTDMLLQILTDSAEEEHVA